MISKSSAGWIGKRETDVFPLQGESWEGLGYGEEEEEEGSEGGREEGEGMRKKGGGVGGKERVGCSISFFIWKHTIPDCPTMRERLR